MDVTKIGNKIRERRTALNMTQKDLALKMNISNQLISKWETGESLPSLEYLDSLCNALEVDFTFFTKDDEQPPAAPSTTTQPQTAPPTDEKPKTQKQKKPKRKVNVLLIVIICTCVLAAIFIAGTTLLTYFAIVPAANKQRYIREMDNSIDNYFSRGYYDIARKLQIDGDDEDDVIYKGVVDDKGNIAFYNSEDGITYADGIITDNVNETKKYRAEIPEHVKSLEDLVKWQIFNDEEDDFDLDYIRYVRRTGKGFYMEMSEEYLTEDMDGSVKKNIKFLDKIKGETVIKDGVFSSLTVTVKYRNTTDNENFTIVSGFEFKDSKPKIALSNLENRQWGDGYYEYAPKCQNLVTQENFMAKLGAKKAVSQSTELGEAILNEKIGYAEGYIYCWQDNKITLYNPDDLSLIKTYKVGYGVENVYVYNNNLYFREKTTNFNNEFNAINLTDGTKRTVYNIYADEVLYNGKYCWFNTLDGYCVLDLSDDTLYYKNDTYLKTIIYVDDSGNVYTDDIVEDKLKVFYSGKGEGVIFKGRSYLHFIDGGTVYTMDYTVDYNNEYYRYENGVLKETIDEKSYDPRVKGTYNATLDGYYCYSNPIMIYNKDTSYRDAFTAVNLYMGNGGEYNACYSRSLLSICEDRFIVEMANRTNSRTSVAVYDATNLAKPLYYMPLSSDISTPIKVFNAGDKAVICLKQAGGSYSIWIA